MRVRHIRFTEPDHQKIKNLDNHMEEFRSLIEKIFFRIDQQAKQFEININQYLVEKENKGVIKGLFTQRHAKRAIALKFKNQLNDPFNSNDELTEKEHKLIDQHENLKVMRQDMSQFFQSVQSAMEFVEQKLTHELRYVKDEMNNPENKEPGDYYNALTKVYNGLGRSFSKPILENLKDIHDQLKQDLEGDSVAAKPSRRRP